MIRQNFYIDKLFQRDSRKNEELLTGIIIVFLIITILLSLGYYFLVFPSTGGFQQFKTRKNKQSKFIVE